MVVVVRLQARGPIHLPNPGPLLFSGSPALSVEFALTIQCLSFLSGMIDAGNAVASATRMLLGREAMPNADTYDAD